MSGSPLKRARTEAREAAEDLREAEVEKRKKLSGSPIGRKLTQEDKDRLAQARRDAAMRRAAATGKLKANAQEVREHALKELWPKAFRVMEMALDGAIDRGVADRDAINAAFKLWEQRFGKATQRVEQKQEAVTKIVYEAAPFEFDPN